MRASGRDVDVLAAGVGGGFDWVGVGVMWVPIGYGRCWGVLR